MFFHSRFWNTHSISRAKAMRKISFFFVKFCALLLPYISNVCFKIDYENMLGCEHRFLTFQISQTGIRITNFMKKKLISANIHFRNHQQFLKNAIFLDVFHPIFYHLQIGSLFENRQWVLFFLYTKYLNKTRTKMWKKHVKNAVTFQSYLPLRLWRNLQGR